MTCQASALTVYAREAGGSWVAKLFMIIVRDENLTRCDFSNQRSIGDPVDPSEGQGMHILLFDNGQQRGYQRFLRTQVPGDGVAKAVDVVPRHAQKKQQ